MSNNPKAQKYRIPVSDLLNKLRRKLTSFTVLNRQGEMLGTIQDFTIDEDHQLNLVISQQKVESGGLGFLLDSKYIQEVYPGKKSLFVDISKAEIERLPVYNAPNAKAAAIESAKATISLQTNNETNFPQEQFLETASQSSQESQEHLEVLDEEIIRLLGEKLVVNRSKRKIGEVVVRKEVETRIVEVPVQQEKLIVEQIGAEEIQQLAEIDLGETKVTGIVEQSTHSANHPYTVTGEFLSPRAASDILAAIALQEQHGCTQVRVELIVENPDLQENYQQMFSRCSKS